MEKAGYDLSHIADKANSFHLPIGWIPGRGYILVDHDAVQEIDQSQFSKLRFKIEGSGVASYNRTVTLEKLIILSIQNLTAPALDNKGLYLVELTDVRFLLARTALVKSYNVVTPANDLTFPYVEGATSKYYRGDNYTWITMLEDIWAETSGLGSLDLSNASFPPTAPENWEFPGVSVLEALKRIGETTGNILVVGLDGSCKLQRKSYYDPANDSLLTEAQSFIQFDKGEQKGQLHAPPEKVIVVFPQRRFDFQNTSGLDQQPTWHDRHRMSPVYTVEKTLGLPGAIPGTKAILHDTMPALASANGTILNQADLQARADAIIGEAYKYPENRGDIYSGAWPFVPNARFDKISWYDIGYGLFTRINIRYNLDPLYDLEKTRAWANLLQENACVRPQVPNLNDEVEYNDRWGIARLEQDLPKGKTALARVQYGVPSTTTPTFSDSSYQIRVVEALGRDYKQGDKVYVVYHRQMGQWLVVASTGDGQLIRFKMRSKLPLGGKGRAIEIGTGPSYTEKGDVFPIKDPWTDPGMWREDVRDELRPQKGYMGWCVLPPDAEILNVSPNDPLYDLNGQPVREIVWMEQIARSITFTLKDPIQSGSAEAYVNNYYLQGKNPLDTDLNISQGDPRLVVYDPQGLFPRALAGAKGKARYNDRQHRYEIVTCNQMAILLTANLPQDVCEGTSSFSLPSNQINVATFPPYGQKPGGVSITVHNPLDLEGKQGDFCVIMWEEAQQRWILLQVQHKLLRILEGIYLAEEDSYTSQNPQGCNPYGQKSCKVVANYIYISTPSCERRLSEDAFIFQPQEVLTDWFVDGLMIKAMASTVYVPCKTPEYECDLEQGVACPDYGSPIHTASPV
jgi:hypothetical protein